MRKTATIGPGREVVVGSGDYRQYAEVQRIEGETVYLILAGRKRLVKFDIREIEVELAGGRIVPAKLPLDKAT